jgi:hypothetical protein
MLIIYGKVILLRDHFFGPPFAVILKEANPKSSNKNC